jgi:hypothetical protein
MVALLHVGRIESFLILSHLLQYEVPHERGKEEDGDLAYFLEVITKPSHLTLNLVIIQG